MHMRMQHTTFALMVEGENRYLNLVNLHLGIHFPLHWEAVSQFVIPAKYRKAGREPGSSWIPDLARRKRTRPE